MSRYNQGWKPYIPVAQRRANALQEMQNLRKDGKAMQPVEIVGRTIARSFWGKGWCKHLESFGDYSNRLPRGRSYARNGSVCHLEIQEGNVEAFVSGSSLYEVTVTIAPLKKGKWKTLTRRCTGKIGSLIALLQGKLSDDLMKVVADREEGLFPLPGEIKYECDCPDWAGMCKHIAAVMYGIGARLDTSPELLFTLRGVDHEELISADAATSAIANGGGSERSRRRSLSGKNIADVFGVELADSHPEAAPRKRTKKAAKKAAKKKAAGRTTKSGPPKKKRAASKTQQTTAFKPSARSVSALRRKLAMNKSEFARAVGVSPPTVTNWESRTGALKLHPEKHASLVKLQRKAAGRP